MQTILRKIKKKMGGASDPPAPQSTIAQLLVHASNGSEHSCVRSYTFKIIFLDFLFWFSLIFLLFLIHF